MKRALAILAVLVLLVLPVVGGATQEASAPQISIEHFAFGTPKLSVTVGTTVTWVNHDDLHTVTSSNGLFASPGLDTDDVFAYHFTAPGTYAYRCALHPHMTGTTIVQGC